MRHDLLAALSVLVIGAATTIAAAAILWNSAAALLVAGLYVTALGVDLLRGDW